MTTPIDFYFDFSSPYGYLGSQKIDVLAARHGRDVVWHPVLLGAVFKATGGAPLTTIPIKGDYSRHDFARSARFHGVPFRLPDRFPISTHNAARVFIWLDEHDKALAKRFAHAAYHAYFVDNVDISDAAPVAAIADTLGVERAALEQALADPALKAQLRVDNDAALARGVFGSPFFFVDGEPFWGVDRLPQLEKWLESGGF
jgi:2-hydroxychromene-2-carboxylate isomerase